MSIIMPVLWRYLLLQYLKVFCLCVVAFVAILMTMRLNEIASFITLGAQSVDILWFTLQQIPYILPIAIPVSALISSMLLVQNLSQAHELTALRASGFALKDILTPIIVASLFLSTLNFYIVSELSTASHLNTGALKSQLRSINPLLLINNKHIMRMKGFFFETLGPSHVGEFAQDVLFFAPDRHHNRMHLMVAKQLKATSSGFVTENMTLLTSKETTLFVENIQQSTTPIQDFSKILEKNTWTINNDHLRLPELLIRLTEEQTQLKTLKQQSATSSILKNTRENVNKATSEIIRRVSVALAVLSFTLMGLSFGINISRQHSNRTLFYVIALGALFLVAFFAAKSFSHLLIPAILLYLLPHVIICATSLWMLYRIAHGIENKR